jgi:hypothetical protein
VSRCYDRSFELTVGKVIENGRQAINKTKQKNKVAFPSPDSRCQLADRCSTRHGLVYSDIKYFIKGTGAELFVEKT